MKKIVLIVLLTLLGGGLSAQTNSRKAARQVEKARRAAMDSVLHLGAVQALESGAFVVEVDRLIFKRGRTASVSSNTNFVSRDGDEAFVQIAFNTVLAGPNGVGGITVARKRVGCHRPDGQKRISLLRDERSGDRDLRAGRYHADSGRRPRQRDRRSELQQQPDYDGRKGASRCRFEGL